MNLNVLLFTSLVDYQSTSLQQANIAMSIPRKFLNSKILLDTE